jgi:hypothetical protein
VTVALPACDLMRFIFPPQWQMGRPARAAPSTTSDQRTSTYGQTATRLKS